MTVLTKPSLMSKKEVPHGHMPLCPAFIEGGLKEEHQPQEADVLYLESTPSLKRSTPALLCLAVVALMVLSAGLLCGVVVYREAIRPPRPAQYYQGFCVVPVEMQDPRETQDETVIMASHYRVPLQWSETPPLRDTPADDVEDMLLLALRERLDISPMLENISVLNGPSGRPTSFIHDFNANVSGIVDSDRCFLMDLDRSAVLPPGVFILNIESDAQFEVARVRNHVRALLPALVNIASRALADRCDDKPVYRLEQQPGTIRKRSTDPITEAHFAHFAGKHVQEVAIANLDELVAAERAG